MGAAPIPTTVGARTKGRRGTVRTVLESVFQRVAANDPSAVRECIDRFGGLVWSLARRFSSSEAEAEDAVQEIFLSLWQSASRFDPASGSDSTFVAMIARRRLIDRVRARQREHRIERSAEAIPDRVRAGERLEIVDEARHVEAAVTGLSAQQQRVMRLSIQQGLSHEQISRATGLPLGTVKTQIRRGLIRVREMLRKAEG